MGNLETSRYILARNKQAPPFVPYPGYCVTKHVQYKEHGTIYMCLAGIWGLRNIMPGLLEVGGQHESQANCGADNRTAGTERYGRSQETKSQAIKISVWRHYEGIFDLWHSSWEGKKNGNYMY